MTPITRKARMKWIVKTAVSTIDLQTATPRHRPRQNIF
jgi:hypothetical protein